MRRSWGSITRLGPNRYRLRYWANGADGYRRRTEIVRGTRKEAGDRLAALRVEHSSDVPVPTVGQIWARWVLPDKELAYDNGQLSLNTLRQYRSTWGAHIEPRWGDVPCDSVRAIDIQEWISSKRPAAAHSSLTLARQVLDYAVRYEFISSNPFSVKYIMPSADTTTDKSTWTLGELLALWRDHVRGEWYEASFILCAFGGCRVGESLGVLASEVERAEVDGTYVALVPIKRQVTMFNLTDRLKTKASRRTVVVPGEPGERLCELASDATRWLVDDGTGNTSDARQLNRSWKAVASHPYRNLRNSWQTFMRWELGVPPYLIETLMGHSTAGVTGQYYDRPSTLQMASTVARAFRTYKDTKDTMQAK